VLIADAAASVREALRWALESEAELSVVGEAADGADALRQALALAPDVVILGTDLPVEDGFAVTRALRAQVTTAESQQGVITGESQESARTGVRLAAGQKPQKPTRERLECLGPPAAGPVVVLLAIRDSPAARRQGRAAGGDGFAAKGDGWAALIGEVRRALAWRGAFADPGDQDERQAGVRQLVLGHGDPDGLRHQSGVHRNPGGGLPGRPTSRREGQPNGPSAHPSGNGTQKAQ
jgi:DNA-binding NarL/FixJ family response regulator